MCYKFICVLWCDNILQGVKMFSCIFYCVYYISYNIFYDILSIYMHQKNRNDKVEIIDRKYAYKNDAITKIDIAIWIAIFIRIQ